MHAVRCLKGGHEVPIGSQVEGNRPIGLIRRSREGSQVRGRIVAGGGKDSRRFREVFLQVEGIKIS